ncbi:DUF2793 domain-containing protein [Methylobacterium sp. NFXW15]|uniref:DUF2793 domain-containing protein n=1 Tax=Methylobacterium sp. NFXW15 TaxID=2819512 RepID=UPI003CFAFDBF
MSDLSPVLGLPLMAAAQSQKHVTHNEALIVLDSLVQLACLDKDLATPPANPAEGDRYLIASSAPTGAWSGWAGRIVRYQDGQWIAFNAKPGWLAYVLDEKLIYAFTGQAWTAVQGGGSGGGPGTTGMLGINASADTTNRLALKSDAALFAWDDVTPGSGDMRLTVNKKAAAKDAGFVFQTGWSSRALFGTLGGDDFVLKTSPDGSVFRTALTAAAATGIVSFDLSPTAPTPAAGDNSTKLATTAYVDAGDAASRARRQVSDASATIQPGDRTVAVIALTAGRTLTLPAASSYPPGATLTVLDESGACSAAKPITLVAQGADTISGLAAAALVTPYASLALQSNGANKWTVNAQAPTRNDLTYVDVANGSLQDIPASFTRVGLARVRSDPGGNWSTADNWYTCPRRGLYLINGTLRVGDKTAAGTQYGVGVSTAEDDGPWFVWHIVGPTPGMRSTYPYSRIASQNAGDRLRMYSYSDQGFTVNLAGLQIYLLADSP